MGSTATMYDFCHEDAPPCPKTPRPPSLKTPCMESASPASLTHLLKPKNFLPLVFIIITSAKVPYDDSLPSGLTGNNLSLLHSLRWASRDMIGLNVC